MNGTSAGKLIVVNRTSGTLWRLQTWHLMRLTGHGSEFSLYGTWHGPQFITTSPVDLKIVKKQPDNDSVKVSYECIFPEIGKHGPIQTHCYALFIWSICICVNTLSENFNLFCRLAWITWVKGPFALSEFFDLCRCFIWTLNWILYQFI